MLGSQSSCSGRWPLRQRRPGRPEPRWTVDTLFGMMTVIIMSMITRMSTMKKARAKVDTFVMMMVTMMSLVTMMTVMSMMTMLTMVETRAKAALCYTGSRS